MNIVLYKLVRRFDERVVFGAPRVAQMLRGGFERLFLNVKGVDMTARTHGFGEKFGVVSVSHRVVHGGVSLVQMTPDEVFVQLKQINLIFSH